MVEDNKKHKQEHLKSEHTQHPDDIISLETLATVKNCVGRLSWRFQRKLEDPSGRLLKGCPYAARGSIVPVLKTHTWKNIKKLCQQAAGHLEDKKVANIQLSDGPNLSVTRCKLAQQCMFTNGRKAVKTISALGCKEDDLERDHLTVPLRKRRRVLSDKKDSEDARCSELENSINKHDKYQPSLQSQGKCMEFQDVCLRIKQNARANRLHCSSLLEMKCFLRGNKQAVTGRKCVLQDRIRAFLLLQNEL